MPHVGRHSSFRPVKKQPSLPMETAPLSSQAIPPELPDIYDDLPLVPSPVTEKADVPLTRKNRKTGRRSGLSTLSMKNWNIAPPNYG